MKNIHILPTPTDKPSLGKYLVINKEGKPCIWNTDIMGSQRTLKPQNIYITNDEKPKDKNWFIDDCESDAISILYKCLEIKQFEYIRSEFDKHDFKDCKKIILTTDPDLIKDGVQAIDDEFLEWFIKNPSCDEVKVVPDYYELIGDCYKIIIPKEKLTKDEIDKFFVDMVCNPKEEPKQETLEEAAKNYNRIVLGSGRETIKQAVKFGAKWQQGDILQLLKDNDYQDDPVFELLTEYFKNN